MSFSWCTCLAACYVSLKTYVLAPGLKHRLVAWEYSSHCFPCGTARPDAESTPTCPSPPWGHPVAHFYYKAIKVRSGQRTFLPITIYSTKRKNARKSVPFLPDSSLAPGVVLTLSSEYHPIPEISQMTLSKTSPIKVPYERNTNSSTLPNANVTATWTKVVHQGIGSLVEEGDNKFSQELN